MLHWIFVIKQSKYWSAEPKWNWNKETSCFSGFIAIHFAERHQVFLNFQWKQAMRKLSGINFNYTNRRHLFPVNQNLLWQKFELSHSTSSKNSSQINNILKSSQFTEYVQIQTLYQIQQRIYKFLLSLLLSN